MKVLQISQHSYFSVPETILPQGERNYCLFNQDTIDFFASQKEASIPYVKKSLMLATDEKEILETLAITDKLLDNKTSNMTVLYPYLAKYNNSKSPNIQTYLAGIYRKMQVPDAFGPLIAMLVNNIKEKPNSNFDPNEEIGGAILAYIENYSHKENKLDINV